MRFGTVMFQGGHC